MSELWIVVDRRTGQTVGHERYRTREECEDAIEATLPVTAQASWWAAYPVRTSVCPRCGGFIPNDRTPGAYPGATSRWDNQTEVCSGCGVEEALLDAQAGSYRKGGRHLSPDNEDRPWVHNPEADD